MHSAQLAEMYIVVLAEVLLLARLRSLGLNRRGHYPFFALFLLADLVQTIAGSVLTIPFHSPAYWWFWTCSETLLVILQILAAREVWTRIRASYPAIGRIGQEAIEWSFIVALLFSVSSLFFDVFRANWRHWAGWSAALVLRRAIATILALTIATLTLLLRVAPDPVAPNVKRHARIFAAYLATTALPPFLAAAQLVSSPVASVLQLGFADIWFTLWLLAFRRGQDEPPPTGGTATQEELDAAIKDLRSLVGGIRGTASRLFGQRSADSGEQVQGQARQSLESGSQAI